MNFQFLLKSKAGLVIKINYLNLTTTSGVHSKNGMTLNTFDWNERIEMNLPIEHCLYFTYTMFFQEKYSKIIQKL